MPWGFRRSDSVSSDSGSLLGSGLLLPKHIDAYIQKDLLSKEQITLLDDMTSHSLVRYGLMDYEKKHYGYLPNEIKKRESSYVIDDFKNLPAPLSGILTRRHSVLVKEIRDMVKQLPWKITNRAAALGPSNFPKLVYCGAESSGEKPEFLSPKQHQLAALAYEAGILNQGGTTMAGRFYVCDPSYEGLNRDIYKSLGGLVGVQVRSSGLGGKA